VEASKVAKVVGKGKVICNNVDLQIEPGHLVAIIGGSGAGKSTIMNCLSGYSQPTSGQVTVNGVDLYQSFDILKNIIGYVPQQDIVYDNLTVESMLRYAAELRLPKDTTEQEFNVRIAKVIEMVELTKHKDTMISRLSGGQRKRASIAVEMLPDPNLFFLDEPASGLDPGTERNLMRTLKNMTYEGKTIILVTHSTLNLQVCDKVMFMGAGGNLCFYGNLEEAKVFFKVDDVVDVYNMITDNAPMWRQTYDATQVNRPRQVPPPANFKQSPKKEMFTQTKVLFKRNMNIIMNDRTRLMLILLQAPILALLIALVAGDGATRQMLFVLSCVAFWLGAFSSIQEICKERVILRREYMTGVRLDSYIVSKMFVMALVCGVQAFALTTIFAAAVGIPDGSNYLVMLITVYLAALSAAATGLLVSALFKNPDRAMTVAAPLLLPQMLFAGLIFKLDGFTDTISNLVICRWAIEAMQSGMMMTLYECQIFAGETVREAADGNVALSWLMMSIFIVVFTAAAGYVLRSLKSERS
jgi:ABC-type multidrug transport system ATPase subunit